MSDTLIVPNFGQTKKLNESTDKKEMLTVRNVNGCPHVKINSSSLSLIQSCPRKSQYSLFEGWKSKYEADALVYGKAIHKALEVFYTYKSRERELPRNFTTLAPSIAFGGEPTEKHFIFDALKAFVADAQSLQHLPDTDRRSLISGIWVLSHYFKTYLRDGYSVLRDDTGPFLERSFSFEFHRSKDLIIELFGTIDFAFQSDSDGSVIVGDHKTTSMMGMPFLNRIKPNHQYTGYLIGARELGIIGDQFLVNGIQVKAKPLTARGGPPTFTRQITRRTAFDFQEFRELLVENVNRYLHWASTGIWPLGSPDACSNYGGCQYLDICAAPNELRNNILESNFRKEN